ncbi:reverse transcriptase [Gossypium australe]|uniref:Reverse transcriptase n=1 Tax=Gossypium australe TaxID=47621 RepID=A0A5B6VPI6_9ROSI|nr:reverse transcriptase [Gossypium australe]
MRYSNDLETYSSPPNMISFGKGLNWSVRYLSQRGNEATYSIACFLLPKFLCGKLESIMAKFWWQKRYGKKGIHLCGWDQLCKLKENRGFGFKSLPKFNVALLKKQGRRILRYPNSLLARVRKFTFIYLEKHVGSEGALTEGTMLEDFDKGRPLATKVCQFGFFKVNFVSDLIDTQSREWRKDIIFNTFPKDVAKRILMIPLAKEAFDDILESFVEFPSYVTQSKLHKGSYKLLVSQVSWSSGVNRTYLAGSTNEQYRVFCCGNWGIWFNRNQSVHEGKKLSSKDIADWTTSCLYEHDTIKEKSHSRSNVFARWSPPFDAEVKVNFDAAFNLIQIRSGVGVVTRNVSGEILASKMVLHKGFLPCLQWRLVHACSQ